MTGEDEILDTEGVAETENLSLSDALDKAMADVPAEVFSEADEPVVSADAKDTIDRPRDPKGRFAAKTDEDPAETAEAVVSEETLKAEVAQPDPNLKPPADASADAAGDKFRGWTKEQQAQFSKLPREAQDLVIGRQTAERQYAHQRIQEYERFRETVNPLVETAVEHADYFRSVGRTPVDAIKGLINTERQLRQGTWAEKLQVMDYLHQTYLGTPYQPPAVDEFAEDPRQPHSPQYPVWHDIQQRQAQVEADNRRLKAQMEQAEHAQLQAHVNSYASQTDKYPRFQLLRGAMAGLIQRGQAKTVEEAYAMADAPMKEAIAKELAARSGQGEAGRKAALEKAKRAQPIKSSGIAPGGSNGKMSLRDAIDAASTQL